MKRNNIKLLFIGLILIFFGCGDRGKNQQTHSLGESKYSAWLSYQRTELGVKLYIKDPDHKMPTQVVWCTSTPQKIKATNSNTLVLNVDNLKVATNAATHVGMMVTLNARDCIGAVSLGKYLYDPKVKDRFADGLIMEIGSSSVPFEQLIKNKIKLWVSAGMEPLDQAKKERFNALGIHWIPNYDWREEHPLGKAEWLLFFGAITNRFDEAERQFKAICKRYDKLNILPEGNSCQKILVGNFAGDYWYSPLQNSFQAQFFNQVDFCTFSMKYKGTGSMAVGAERIYQEAADCELWLNPGFPTKQAILNAFPKAIQLHPFSKGSIFCYSHDLNKFWEQSALMPDILLRDLIRIKQGNSADSMLYFYREVK